MSESDWQRRLEAALSDCANEPIHQPGAIQPSGVLLAYDDSPQRRITQMSANWQLLFDRLPKPPLGVPLAALLGEAAVATLDAVKGLGEWRSAALLTLPLGDTGAYHNAQLSGCDDGCWLLELELQPCDLAASSEPFLSIRDMLWQLDGEPDQARYLQRVVEQIRLISGYDRVMIYRFASSWSGEVVAESRDSEMGTYLGHHFPASDIPSQARVLYQRNLIRVLADVEAETIPLLTEPSPNAVPPLDMSLSALRAFSPIHLDYLRNMGVRATMTLSLLQHGRLWGLIACHHRTPKRVPLAQREHYEFIAKTVALRLSAFADQRREAISVKLHRLLSQLAAVAEAPEPQAIATQLQQLMPSLLTLLQANGVVISVAGQRFCWGETPPPAVWQSLQRALQQRATGTLWYSNHLAADLPACPELPHTAGLLQCRDQQRQAYVAWLRPALPQTLTWAGDPGKGVAEQDGVLRISPRQSFASWIETVRDRAATWQNLLIDTALALQPMLLGVVSALTDKRQRGQMPTTDLQLLTHHSGDLIAHVDSDGYFTFLSGASERLLGYPPEALIGAAAEDLLVADDRPQLARIRSELMAATAAECRSAHTHSLLVRIHRVDRTTLWMECNITPFVDRDGRCGMVLNGRDVTQRHTYQLAMEELHQRNAQILDAAVVDGIISTDRAGYIVYANEHAGRLLGYSVSDLVSLHCCQLLVEGPVSEVPSQPDECALLQQMRAQRLIQSQCYTFRHRSGYPILMELNATPLTGQSSDGGCVLVFGPTPERLDDQQRGEQVVRHVTEAVMVTEPDGTIISVNPAFTTITGYRADEVLGRNPRLLKSGVHTPQFYQGIWQQLEQQRHWSGEVWNRRKSGEIYPQWGSISVITDEQGRVRNYVSVFTDISKARQAEERLRFLASHDALTGLPNRNHFLELLGGALQQAQQRDQQLAIAFFDLDRFKLINDSLGHAAGDQYLSAIARRIADAVAPDDQVSRWGGDEFIAYLLLPSGTHDLSARVAHISQQVSAPLLINGHELAPTTSIGVSLFPDDASSADDLVMAADTAMYQVKEQGRNGFHFYTERLGTANRERFEVVSELHRALRERELLLHYQPQIDSRDGHIIGFEALVRWNHPVRGELLPGRFIPQAEELGLIPGVGAVVLDEACRQLQQWQQQQLAIPQLSINIAPNQLTSPLLDQLAALLDRYQIAPERLELEITEGVLARTDSVLPVLTGLHQMGIRLAIDDFGTGYSSLNYLKQFPIQRLKVDKSFVDGLPHDRRDVAILRTVVALGQYLDIDVLVEGVEKGEQLAFLQDVGAYHIQGFYYSRPLPAEQVPAYLAQQPVAPAGRS